MAANTLPIFPLVPVVGIGSLSIANTNRDGSGTIVDLATAGVDGLKVEAVRLIAVGVTTAGVIRLFVHNGTAYHLFDEILVTAITPSESVRVWEDWWLPDVPLVLPSGYKIAASTHNAEGFRAMVIGGSYS